MQSNNTISAICTGHGGAIAVLRVSGNDALKIVSKIFKPLKKGFLLENAGANRVYNGFIVDGENEVDRVVLTVYRAPHSYTGEDVVEMSCKRLHSKGDSFAFVEKRLFVGSARRVYAPCLSKQKNGPLAG